MCMLLNADTRNGGKGAYFLNKMLQLYLCILTLCLVNIKYIER